MSVNHRRLILARHGQSTSNAAQGFTGRRDVPLTEHGCEQARAIGRHLLARGLVPDCAFCSTLSRTDATASLILDVLGKRALMAVRLAALDERDYGILSGLNKQEAEARWGSSQIETWRRSYLEGPPGGESLRDTLARVAPGLLHCILPAAMRGTALVVAHGNSLRVLVMMMENLSPVEVEQLEIPVGSMRVYALAADTSIERCELVV